MHQVLRPEGAVSGEDPELIARVSRLLAGSLNVDHLVGRLLDLLVPDRVDYAQVTITAGRGSHRVVARSCLAPGWLRTVWQPPGGDPRSVAGVTASGHRALLSRPSAGDLEGLVPPRARNGEGGVAPPPAAEAVVLPLSARGTVFGTLTLLASDEGALAGRDRLRVWADVADRAALAFDSARMYQERQHALEVMERDLYPPSLPTVDGLSVAAFYRAADTEGGLGGDFYDIHGDARDWTVVLGDVSGKGVEAAVLAGRARQTIRTAALVDRRPAAVLDLLNRVLVSSAAPQDERFLTVVCARLRHTDDRGWMAEVASAGHPAPLIVRSGGAVEPVGSEGPLVGLLSSAAYSEQTVTLAWGDTMFLFTDGVTESRDANGEQFGTARVAGLLGELPGAEPDAVVSHIAYSALDWRVTAGQDDVALLAIRADAPGA